MNPGYIYALQNNSFGDYLIKIGRTTREPCVRAKEMYAKATGVPEPFNVAFACRVSDCVVAESRIHRRLEVYRHNKGREFFTLPIEVVRKIILSTCQEVNAVFGHSTQDIVFIDSEAGDSTDSVFEHGYIGEPHKIIKLTPDEIPKKLLLSPPGTSSLSKEQKERVEIITEVFASVHLDAVENWLIDFSRDGDPESEIRVWEDIAKAFLRIHRIKYLNEEQKKEAYFLLLFRSMMPLGDVLKSFHCKTFSKKAAKEVLRGYRARPKPISVRDLNA